VHRLRWIRSCLNLEKIKKKEENRKGCSGKMEGKKSPMGSLRIAILLVFVLHCFTLVH
jgi:hypothetical protein